MKKILFLFISLAAASCATVRKDVKTQVKVEEVYAKYKYLVIAWRYKPSIRKYVVKTDSLYRKGSIIEFKEK